MNKTFKIFLVSLLILIFSLNYSFYITNASESNSSSQQEDEDSSEVIKESPTSGLSTLSSNDVTSVSSMNSYSEANLALNNILSIILISVGVVLILFAIAILIRLKH